MAPRFVRRATPGWRLAVASLPRYHRDPFESEDAHALPFAELLAAGITFPAAVVSELE
jgi:hypothetical protein